MSNPEIERNPEPHIDSEYHREKCLLRLLTQAEGRQVDGVADGFLIEQINGSVIQEHSDGSSTLLCLDESCALLALVRNRQGSLKVDHTNGLASCEQRIPIDYRSVH